MKFLCHILYLEVAPGSAAIFANPHMFDSTASFVEVI